MNNNNSNNTIDKQIDFIPYDLEWEKEMLKKTKSELIEIDLLLTKEKDELMLRLKSNLNSIMDKEYIIDDIRKTSILKERALETKESFDIEH